MRTVLFLLVIMSVGIAAPASKDYDYNYYDYGECEWTCPQKYTPVCAVNEYGDNKEFASYCRMVLYNCRNAHEQFYSDYVLDYKGEC